MITIQNEFLTAEIDEKGAQLSRLATKNAEYIIFTPSFDNPPQAASKNTNPNV